MLSLQPTARNTAPTLHPRPPAPTTPATASPPASPDLATVIARSQDYFRHCQYPAGYWWGTLESNPTMEAEYLLLSWFLEHRDSYHWQPVVNYILSKQQANGSWGQYYGSPGDLSTSVECYFALKLAGCSPESEPLQRAKIFILSKGGIPQTRVFTKIWLALFGQWDWNGVPNMPPELIFLPSWAPFNIYDFSSWARSTIVPMLLILTHRPVCPIPESAAIDELYPQPRHETDYPLPKPAAALSLSRLFYYLDRFLGRYRRFPCHPFRRRAERKIIDWIIRHQDADGSWGGIQPPWVYSLLALRSMGFPADHPILEKGYNGFAGFAVEDENRRMLQACISPVWDTCLVQQALLASGLAPDDAIIQRSTRWLLSQQIDAPGDWQVRAPNIPPGGWAFEFHNNFYPDIDDAAEVIIALRQACLSPAEEPARRAAIQRGVHWLAALQCKNGGWAAFDKDNNRRYLSKLPFFDFGEVIDPPSADVTAHVVEMFGRLGYPRDYPPIKRAYQYLRQQQEPNGSWFGRWGVNYIYGTGAVLSALAAIGEDLQQPYIQRAIAWLLSRQNSDGGWGESCASYINPQIHGVGPSTPSQTAWALLALLAAGAENHPATGRGIAWLAAQQRADGSWDEPYFTGTGFPGYGDGAPPQPNPVSIAADPNAELSAGFMINYSMYRNCWPLLALGRYRCQTSG